MQGYLKGKEKNGINYFNTDLEYEFEIGETSVQEMGTDGNVFVQNHKVHLEKNNIQLTKDYWDIVELWNDHYAVCDLSVSNCYLDGLNQYTLKSELEALGPKFGPKINFKYGVIRLKRNDKGEVIPFAEKMIVPIVYDRICENNDDSLTAYSNGKLTYIELDPRSLNYGKQLIPAVLEHAVAFSLKYQGFAECSVDGITGYLPRYCKPLEKINGSDLLTEEQVKYLLNNNDSLNDYSAFKLEHLTGSPKVLKYR